MCSIPGWRGSALLQAHHGFLLLRSAVALELVVVCVAWRESCHVRPEVFTGVLSGKRWTEAGVGTGLRVM